MVESTQDSVYDITCLGSEIDPQFLVEEFALSKTQFIGDLLTFPVPLQFRSSECISHHSNTNSHQITETVFINGGSLHALRMENKFLGLTSLKQFDYTYLSFNINQSVMQNAKLRSSKGRLFHTKSGIFGFSSSFSFYSNPKNFESNPAVIKSNPTGPA
jgi:hypothetical protein